jgi:hypothetical protein
MQGVAYGIDNLWPVPARIQGRITLDLMFVTAHRNL